MPRQKKKPPTPDNVRNAAVQPPRAPTGLPQGEHQALVQSQQQQPMADAQGRLSAAIAAANPQDPNSAPMGAGDALLQPTARPDEPVTAGLPMGAGPGPEAMQAPAIPTTPDDYELARYLPMLELLADRPNSTAQTRNFVRRMRGSLPANVNMEDVVKHVNPQPPG